MSGIRCSILVALPLLALLTHLVAAASPQVGEKAAYLVRVYKEEQHSKKIFACRVIVTLINVTDDIQIFSISVEKCYSGSLHATTYDYSYSDYIPREAIVAVSDGLIVDVLKIDPSSARDSLLLILGHNLPLVVEQYSAYMTPEVERVLKFYSEHDFIFYNPEGRAILSFSNLDLRYGVGVGKMNFEARYRDDGWLEYLRYDFVSTGLVTGSFTMTIRLLESSQPTVPVVPERGVAGGIKGLTSPWFFAGFVFGGLVVLVACSIVYRRLFCSGRQEV